MIIISLFLWTRGEKDQLEVSGKVHLQDLVSYFVERGETIEFVFPAFPFKSPSNRKVLGPLPDLGEEILLRRLDALARAIQEDYAPGAVIRVVSDGVVYGRTSYITESDVPQLIIFNHFDRAPRTNRFDGLSI